MKYHIKTFKPADYNYSTERFSIWERLAMLTIFAGTLSLWTTVAIYIIDNA